MNVFNLAYYMCVPMDSRHSMKSINNLETTELIDSLPQPSGRILRCNEKLILKLKKPYL